MKNYYVSIIAIAFATLNSCTPAQKESNTEAIKQLKQVQQTNLSADTSAIISSVPATVPSAAAIPVEQSTVNKSTTPPELNPPHGQPFHRCDIPVGSPLNAAATPVTSKAPAQPAQPVQTVNRNGTAPTLENAARLNNPQANNQPAPAAANTSKPKLNPPHGQPFHRCDIAVGSPLP